MTAQLCFFAILIVFTIGALLAISHLHGIPYARFARLRLQLPFDFTTRTVLYVCIIALCVLLHRTLIAWAAIAVAYKQDVTPANTIDTIILAGVFALTSITFAIDIGMQRRMQLRSHLSFAEIHVLYPRNKNES